MLAIVETIRKSAETDCRFQASAGPSVTDYAVACLLCLYACMVHA